MIPQFSLDLFFFSLEGTLFNDIGCSTWETLTKCDNSVLKFVYLHGNKEVIYLVYFEKKWKVNFVSSAKMFGNSQTGWKMMKLTKMAENTAYI